MKVEEKYIEYVTIMEPWKSRLIKITNKLFSLVLCIFLVVTAYPTSAIAQSNHPIPSQTSPPEPSMDPNQTQAMPGLDKPQELEKFLDSFLPMELQKEQTLGGVVSVVKDGRPFFVKGYGFTDPEHTQPVDGDRTLFRVASL